MRTVLDTFVPGRPVPQGSMQALQLGHQKHASVQPSNKARLLPWRNQVTVETSLAWGGRAPLTGPVVVSIEFRFRRPKGHTAASGKLSKAGRLSPRPTTRGQGDVDKLARAILDGLDAANVFLDDSQVADLHARKVWAEQEGARVWVQVEEVEPCEG